MFGIESLHDKVLTAPQKILKNIAQEHDFMDKLLSIRISIN